MPFFHAPSEENARFQQKSAERALFHVKRDEKRVHGRKKQGKPRFRAGEDQGNAAQGGSSHDRGIKVIAVQKRHMATGKRHRENNCCGRESATAEQKQS